MSATSLARAIAFYLPQFHPVVENDLWWGKGFTEWTNTAKAKPLFAGHYQPRIPADLGFYDLRCPEVRQAQANLAAEYGIEGFCYWHYWFAGKRLLERPFDEVLRSGQPNFPFCLGWANETWTGIWHGAPNRVLMEQSYPGMDDHRAHFEYLLKAFLDSRYIMVEGKPLLVIYKPLKLPNAKQVLDAWREWAREAGLKGVYVVGVLSGDKLVDLDRYGLDAVTFSNQGKLTSGPERMHQRVKRIFREGLQLQSKRPRWVFDYAEAIEHMIEPVPVGTPYHPTAIPNWDNTPRSGSRGLVLHGSTPELFRIHLTRCIALAHQQPPERRIVFLKSWNEWAEGNHLEPDLRFGRGYLQVLKDALT